MRIGTTPEGSKITELQLDQINSSTTKNSEEKSSSAQETSVINGSNEKETKAARELATSKKGDAHFQAMSVKMQLEASETLSTASKPANNVQQLGQSANDKGPVGSTLYAQQKDSASQMEKQNTSESLSKESAGAREVSADNTKANESRANLPKQPEGLSAESVKHNQEIIDAAVTYGRRIETPGLGGQKSITEFIPGERTENLGDMEVYIRTGFETIMPDGSTFKQMNYWQPHSTNKLGYVESIIKDGKETITKIEEMTKGAMSGLKVGDTFDVSPDKSTPAGKMPKSIDPQPDGRYGLSGQPNSQPNNTNDNGGNSKGTETSSEKGGLGRSDPASGSMGFEALGGGAGNAGTKPGTITEHKGGSNTSTNTDGQWEPGPSVRSEYPPTKVEVEQQHQSEHEKDKEKREHGEKPQVERPQKEATHEPTKKDHGSQAAYGDYADLGPAPPPAKFGEERSVVSNGNYHQASPKSDLYGDLYEGPYDFGNPADPNVTETPTGENPIVNDGNLTYTAGPAETNLDNGAGLDMLGTLKNTGNPLDVNEMPVVTPPSTNEAERNNP